MRKKLGLNDLVYWLRTSLWTEKEKGDFYPLRHKIRPGIPHMNGFLARQTPLLVISKNPQSASRGKRIPDCHDSTFIDVGEDGERASSRASSEHYRQASVIYPRFIRMYVRYSATNLKQKKRWRSISA